MIFFTWQFHKTSLQCFSWNCIFWLNHGPQNLLNRLYVRWSSPSESVVPGTVHCVSIIKSHLVCWAQYLIVCEESKQHVHVYTVIVHFKAHDAGSSSKPKRIGNQADVLVAAFRILGTYYATLVATVFYTPYSRNIFHHDRHVTLS